MSSNAARPDGRAVDIAMRLSRDWSWPEVCGPAGRGLCSLEDKSEAVIARLAEMVACRRGDVGVIRRGLELGADKAVVRKCLAQYIDMEDGEHGGGAAARKLYGQLFGEVAAAQ